MTSEMSIIFIFCVKSSSPDFCIGYRNFLWLSNTSTFQFHSGRDNCKSDDLNPTKIPSLSLNPDLGEIISDNMMAYA